MSRKNLSQQFLSATFWNTALFPARLLFGLVASVLYYQMLSLDQVGVLFLLTSLATTIGLYADLGIERTLPRFLPEAERQSGREGVLGLMRQVIRIKLCVLLALVAALAILSRPILQALLSREQAKVATIEARLSAGVRDASQAASLERELDAKKAVCSEIEAHGHLFLAAIGVLLLLGALFDVYMQFLTAYLKQRSWNLITLASTLLQPILVTAFIVAGWGISGVLVGLVLTPLVTLLLAARQVSRASRDLAPVAARGSELPALGPRFARFAAVNYLMQVTTWTYDLQSVIFVSAATLSLEEVAVVGFAYKFAKDLLGYVWTPLTGIIVPVLSRVHTRKDPVALREAHSSLTRIIWLLEVPAAVALLVLVPRVLTVFYPRYEGAAHLVQLLIVFVFADSLAAVPYNVLMVTEQYRPVIAAQLVAFAAIPLALVLLPRQGLLGLAIAVGLARVASRAVTFVAGVTRLGLDFPIRFGSRVVAASAGMGACLLIALRALDSPLSAHGRGVALLLLASISALGVLVFVLALKALGGIHDEERRRLAALPIPFRALVLRVL